MVAQLLKEKEDEIKHKDFCVEEFNTNELQTEKKERSKEDLTAKIEDLDSTIEQLTKAYEEFVKDTNGSIDAKSKDIVNKSESKAKAEGDRVEAKEDKEAVMLELEQLANYKAELHSSCDFVMKNFEIRQTARDEEIEALKQAKAILSGAKFEAFLQSA